MITIEEKMKILKQYLGFFYTKLDKQDIAKYKALITSVEDSYYYGSEKQLKKLACFLLLLRGNEHYKVYNCYELFDIYIGKSEDEKRWSDLKTPLIFLYYPAFTTENRKTEELILHLISHRKINNKITIVLSEKQLPTIENYFSVLDKPEVIPKIKSTVIKSSKVSSDDCM